MKTWKLNPLNWVGEGLIRTGIWLQAPRDVWARDMTRQIIRDGVDVYNARARGQIGARVEPKTKRRNEK